MKRIKVLGIVLLLFILAGCPNRDPEANNDYVNVLKNNSVTIDVTENDYIEASSDFDITISGAPQHGEVAIDGTKLTYTPTENYVGSDSIAYKIYVEDSNNEYESRAKVIIEVKEQNIAPVAVDDYGETKFEQETPKVSVNVIDNDSDEDDGIEMLKIISVGKSQHGYVNFDQYNNYVTYTLNDDDYIGEDSFTYTISDGIDTSTATVYVTVVAHNHAPVTNDDEITGKQDEDIAIDVLANDTDVDQDELTIENAYIVSDNVQHARIYVDDNKLIFNATRPGTYKLSYLVSDDTTFDHANVFVTIQYSAWDYLKIGTGITGVLAIIITATVVIRRLAKNKTVK